MSALDASVPRIGSIRSVQVPGGQVQLGKIVDNRMHEGHPYTLIFWIDIRREPEWVPSSTVPPEGDPHSEVSGERR